MKKTVSGSELRLMQVRCKHCGKKYSLSDTVRHAEAVDGKNLYCPHCNKQVGNM